MAISDHQLRVLIDGSRLIGRYSAALSDFEAETVASVGTRFGRYNRDAVVTDLEWRVVEEAVDAMAKAGHADPCCPKLLTRERVA
jgi:hypothetical protein